MPTATSAHAHATGLISYYAHRASRASFVQWRERLDTLAAQTGSSWRNDVQVPRMVWSSHALCSDVLMLKRDMEQLRSLAAQVPAVARLRDVLSACYLCERGMPEQALAQHEQALRRALEEPGVRAVQFLGGYARILRKAKRYPEALQVCELARAKLSRADAEFSALVFGVQLEHALTLVEQGEHERARAELEAQLLAAARHDNPMIHALLHGACVELAIEQLDGTRCEEHLARMRPWLDLAQHPSLLAYAQRLQERARPESAGSTPKEPALPAFDSLPFDTELVAND